MEMSGKNFWSKTFLNVIGSPIDANVITTNKHQQIIQLTKRARSGRKREKALSRLRSRLSRDGQSANSEKFFKRISSISLWEPEEKHLSTCRVS